MTTYLAFTDLAAALDAHTWEQLQETHPVIARALQAEISRGATAEDVRRFVTSYEAQPVIAGLLTLAARHLERESRS